MIITLKHLKTETHVVYMETCGNIITVAACPLIDDCRAGYPESEGTYHFLDRDKANRTYRRYVKKYGGEIR